MLILTRKKNESIVIMLGDVPIEVNVCEIRGDRVRIGITAPREVAVHRKEVQEAIQAEKRTGKVQGVRK